MQNKSCSDIYISLNSIILLVSSMRSIISVLALSLLLLFTMGSMASAIPMAQAAKVRYGGEVIPSPLASGAGWILIKGQELDGLRSDRMLVGVWTSLGWVELPFITLPLKNNTFTMGYDILYHGKPLREFSEDTVRYVLKNLDKLIENDEVEILNTTTTLYAQPVEIDPEQGILVPLAKDLLAKASQPPAGDWSPEALRRGYDKKLTYTYNGVRIEIYYPGSKEARGRTPLLPPLIKNTRQSLYMGVWHNGRMTPIRLLDKLNPQKLYEQYASHTASLSPIQIKETPRARLLGIDSLASADPMLSNGAYLWYIRYWRDGVLSNHTVMGQENVVLVDYFTTKGNTSRYDIYLRLRSLANTGRTIHVEAYVNGSPIIYDDIVEDGETTYEYTAYTASPDPNDYSNKVWEVRVVLSGLDPGESKWLVDAVPTARAWIQPISWENGVHEVHAQYYGTSSVSYTGDSSNLVQGQYEINPDSGDALLLFTGSSNLIEGYMGAGLSITVKSTPNQKYDRNIEVYMNDHYLGSCPATAPVTNGTEAVRSCVLLVEDVSSYIAESLRRNETPVIRVVVDGYNSNDYRHWFISEAYANFYTREDVKTLGLYDIEDPTLDAGRRDSRVLVFGENYIGCAYAYYYYSYWLNTDMHQSLFTVSVPKPEPGRSDEAIVSLNIPIGSRWPAGQEDPSHSLVKAEIQLSLNQDGTDVIISEPPGAYVPSPLTSPRSESSLIKWGLWVASVLSNVAGMVFGGAVQFVSGMLSLGIQIATAPEPYYYGGKVSLEQINSNTVKLTWDAGYQEINNGSFTIAVTFMPGPQANVWNANPLNISLTGYLRIYVSKKAPNDSPIVPSSLLDILISKNIESIPGIRG